MTTVKLLVPLDGTDFSRQILPYLTRLFSPERCQVQLLHVASSPFPTNALAYPMAVGGDFSFYAYNQDNEMTDRRHPIYDDEDLASFQLQLESELRDESRLFQQAGYQLASRVHFGDPAQEIINVAQAEEVDLVAMMTHGRRGLNRLISGSVAEAVVRHLASPVMLVNAVTGLDEEASGADVADAGRN